MTLWMIFAAFSLVAIGFVVWPMYRQERKSVALIVLAIVFIVGLSAGLYHYQGKPGVASATGSATASDMNAAIQSLAERLESNPDDVEGWNMLGRSYMSVGDNVAATTAFERALAVDPNNQQALFYGGIGAFNRGDKELAAVRWERLLSLNPPAEIEGILRQRIAEWRGEPIPVADGAVDTESPAIPETSPPVERPDVIVSARVSLSAAAMAALQQDAMVFIMARDPAQPTPPIAVTRAMLSQLPVQIEFTDSDSMMEGRSLSAFAEFELIARIAVSGQRTQQPGDWYGVVTVRPAENQNVELSITEQVP